MTKKEKKDLIHFADKLSDSELVAQYYDSVYDCLGSDSEAMYELGMIFKIFERLKHLKNIYVKKLLF